MMPTLMPETADEIALLTLQNKIKAFLAAKLLSTLQEECARYKRMFMGGQARAIALENYLSVMQTACAAQEALSAYDFYRDYYDTDCINLLAILDIDRLPNIKENSHTTAYHHVKKLFDRFASLDLALNFANIVLEKKSISLLLQELHLGLLLFKTATDLQLKQFFDDNPDFNLGYLALNKGKCVFQADLLRSMLYALDLPKIEHYALVNRVVNQSRQPPALGPEVSWNDINALSQEYKAKKAKPTITHPHPSSPLVTAIDALVLAKGSDRNAKLTPDDKAALLLMINTRYGSHGWLFKFQFDPSSLGQVLARDLINKLYGIEDSGLTLVHNHTLMHLLMKLSCEEMHSTALTYFSRETASEPTVATRTDKSPPNVHSDAQQSQNSLIASIGSQQVSELSISRHANDGL